jgi:monooxygenase
LHCAVLHGRPLGAILNPFVQRQWPEDLDLAGQRVVLIGSGATAATILPAIAGTAARVTMLQRSPSYILPMPNADPVADLLRKVLPERRAYAAVRWKNARLSTVIYNFRRKHPARARAMLQNGAAKRLPAGYDIGTHFTPAYEPRVPSRERWQPGAVRRMPRRGPPSPLRSPRR